MPKAVNVLFVMISPKVTAVCNSLICDVRATFARVFCQHLALFSQGNVESCLSCRGIV